MTKQPLKWKVERHWKREIDYSSVHSISLSIALLCTKQVTKNKENRNENSNYEVSRKCAIFIRLSEIGFRIIMIKTLFSNKIVTNL